MAAVLIKVFINMNILLANYSRSFTPFKIIGQVCRETRPEVKVVVAPYEADAQLAFLSNNNLVDAVVSEDSDTIPFGCKICIFKLDKDGFCQIIRQSDIFEKNINGFDLRGE
jgi:5'-3' exonuclease